MMVNAAFRSLFTALALAGSCVPALAVEDAPSGIKSTTVLIVDEQTGEVLYGKNTTASVPIASISKLMTSLVTLDADLPLTEPIEITEDDVLATLPNRSRLASGAMLSRGDLLHLALMASDNRAAMALGRTYPGGMASFVEAMNRKAEALEMAGSRFLEPSGLSSGNVSTAQDLARLVRAAKDYPLIAEYSTDAQYAVSINGRPTTFRNTNALVRAGERDITVQKTGFTNAAGQCLVMYVQTAARSLTIVLLDSLGRNGPVTDATRIRRWLDPSYQVPAAIAFLRSSPAAAAPGPSAVAKSHSKRAPKPGPVRAALKAAQS